MNGAFTSTAVLAGILLAAAAHAQGIEKNLGG